MRVWFVLLVAACGDNLVQHSATLTSGAATLTLDAGTLTLARDGAVRLAFGKDAFRVGTVDDLDSGDSFDPYWLFVDMPPEPPAGLAWHGGTLRLVSADDAHLVVGVDGATITFTPEGTDGFAAQVAASAKQVAYVQVAPDADAHEGFYGLGEWPDVVDHRGTLRPMQMELDTTAEGADDENHVPVPLVIGTTGWGMFVESKRPGAFEVARASDTRVDRDVRHRRARVPSIHRRRAARRARPLLRCQRLSRAAGAVGTRPVDLARREREPGAGARRHPADPHAPPRDDRCVVRSPVLDRCQDVRLERGEVSRSARDALRAPRRGPALRHLADAVHREREQRGSRADAARRTRPQHGVLPAADRRAREPVGQADRLHEPGCLRVVATEPARVHRRRSASRASSSTTPRTSCSACSASARRGNSTTAATSARCTTTTSCSITACIASCSPAAGGLLLTRTGRWGDQVQRHDHLAGRSRRELRARRRHRDRASRRSRSAACRRRSR